MQTYFLEHVLRYADTGLLTIGLESLLRLCLHVGLHKLPHAPWLSLHIQSWPGLGRGGFKVGGKHRASLLLTCRFAAMIVQFAC